MLLLRLLFGEAEAGFTGSKMAEPFNLSVFLWPLGHIWLPWQLVILSWNLSYITIGPGEGNGNPLQYSCLENSMDGGAWWATVHGVAKSQTRLSDFTLTFNNRAQHRWWGCVGRVMTVLRERQMYGRKAWSVTLEWGMHPDLTEEVGEWRIITETWDIRGYKKPHSPTPLPFNWGDTCS